MATETIYPTLSKEELAAAQRKLAIEVEGAHFHPLEGITFFRRWPRSLLRNVVFTFIFNALFAVAFFLLGLMFSRVESAAQVLEAFGRNLLIANVIGFAFWGVFQVIGPATRVINRKHFLVVALFYASIGTVIVTVSFYAITFVPGFGNMRQWVFTTQQMTTSFILSLCISLVLATVWRRRFDELAAQMALAGERERAQAAERAAAQANLRALQAQIEPHFLFNTLANVVGLIHPQPDTAKLMLEKFIAYLRSSLATTREQQTTLGQEFELMANFLSILQIRMGERLAVDLDLPAELAGEKLPSMLLQPLVENAIKHGLEPKVEGGGITLQARRDGDALLIAVIDTGLGFVATSSTGIGLRNVRERLGMLYAGQGSLVIEENKPSGTRVILRLPAYIEMPNPSTGAASGGKMAGKALPC